MVSWKIIVFLSSCCILVSVPVYYTVNIYRMANFVNPSDPLISFIKLLPFLVLLVVLAFGVREVGKLINNNKRRDAGKLVGLLMVLLIVASIATALTYNIGIRYVM